MSFTETLQGLTGKPLADCTNQELYLALLELVRQKSADRVQPVTGRKLYYISAEFLIGLPIPGIKQERIGASAVILSPIASQERPQYRGLEEVTKEEDTYLRIFGKPFTRVNRRMGVVLCYAPLDSDLDALRDKAKRIAEKVEVH